MMVYDCTLVCRGLWGGYSPKVDDRVWTQIRGDVVEAEYAESTCVGDGHFDWASRHLQGVKFLYPHREPKKGRLTKAQQNDNTNIRIVRNDVETPFGWTKQHFKLASIPWREGKDDQDNLIYFTIGCWNFQRPPFEPSDHEEELVEDINEEISNESSEDVDEDSNDESQSDGDDIKEEEQDEQEEIEERPRKRARR